MKQGLIALTLIVLLGVTGVVAACCGSPQDTHITVSIVGKPDCDVGRGGSTVGWKVAYNLPTSPGMAVFEYGDNVAQDSDYYPNMPDGPESPDIKTGKSTWEWEQYPLIPIRQGYKVRVEFRVTTGPDSEDRALIVFDCTLQGAANIAVHNQ